MRDKVLYEVDPHNRLIVNIKGKSSNVKKFRKVVLGRFNTDSKNKLFYQVNKSQGLDTPQKIGFSGNYFLGKENSLIFSLDKWNNQCEGNRLTLRTKIIDAKSDEIAFLLNTRLSETKELVYIMKISGAWQMDKKSRLTFAVKRENGIQDKLTLSGGWEINKNNEIIYSCGSGREIITLKGKWEINDRYHISYQMDDGIGSGFNFKISMGKAVIKGRDMSLNFNIGYDKKIIFTGNWKFGKNNAIILETTPYGEQRSLGLKFAREFFDKNGLAYLETFNRDKETFAGGGVTFKW